MFRLAAATGTASATTGTPAATGTVTTTGAVTCALAIAATGTVACTLAIATGATGTLATTCALTAAAFTFAFTIFFVHIEAGCACFYFFRFFFTCFFCSSAFLEAFHDGCCEVVGDDSDRLGSVVV
jgi:hypothetical protein